MAGPAKKSNRVLKQRVITAAILAPLVIAGIVLLPTALFALFVLLVVAMGAWEWAKMSGLQGVAAKFFVIFLAGCCFLLYLFGSNLQQGVLYLGSLFWLFALAMVISFPGTSRLWSKSWQRALMGLLILVPAWVGLVWLKGRDNSGVLVILLLVIIWSADIGAYFSGRALGKHKLSPAVSPGKSWEGVFGGLILAILAATLYAQLFDLVPEHTPAHWISFVFLVFITAAISVLGDLTESMVKRQQGLKDSGHLLPGHGGIMDRIDSLVAVVPLFALWFAA